MRVVSLFAGAGGLDLGLIRTGHNVVWANDFDPDAVETYRRNIGAHVVGGPIERISTSDIPSSDAIVGGFPCQGFSQANKMRSADDPRNSLYREFVRILLDKQPNFFIAENVRGLTSLDSGRAFSSITDGFVDSGYRVKSKVLNAADFGAPQNRHRLIFLGVRQDLPEGVDLDHPDPTHYPPGSRRLPAYKTVRDALRGIPDPIEFPDAVPNQQYSRYKFVERNFTGHRSTDWDKPSPTILARGNGGGGVNATPHPSGSRRMSVRESAAIQGFPSDFEFHGRLGSSYRQVGNAIPIPLAEALGRSLSIAGVAIQDNEVGALI